MRDAVLIVDDMPVNLLILRGLLEARGLDVDTAESGEECLALCDTRDYRIIFLDYRMPGIDGIETLGRLREHFDAAGTALPPVIALTGNEGEGVREDFLSRGFFEYLQKPVDPVRLDEVLKKAAPDLSFEDVEAGTTDGIPRELYDIRQLNLKAGIHHCGNIDAYINALMIFGESAKGRQAELWQAYDDHNIERISHVTHALKSTSGAIGANGISQLSAWIEDAAEAGDNDVVYEKVPQLLDEYRALGDRLAGIFGTKDEYFPDDDMLPEITPDKLSDAYLTLGECLGFYDYNSISVILESLREYHIPEDERRRLDDFHAAASVFDRNRMRAIIDAFFSESEKK